MLSASTIELALHANARETLFTELIDKIPSLRQKPEARAKLLQALLEREKLCSTGLGEGVALPHTRNTIAGMGERAILVFGRHASGIDYGAIDGAPVKLFFLLLAPNVSQHLHILARLTRLLRAPQIRQNLLHAPTPAGVIALIHEAEEKMQR